MRRDPLATIRLGVLALAVGGLLGPQCNLGGTGIAPWTQVSSIGTYSPFTVEINVLSQTPIQAFELGLRWDPEMLSGVEAFPHPGFDDDEAFFSSPRFEAGKLDGVVDLRHGGEGAVGLFGLAIVHFVSRGNVGSTSIELTGVGLAEGNGSKPQLIVSPLTITIEP